MPASASPTPAPAIFTLADGTPCHWHPYSQLPQPKRLHAADDRTSANTAYRLACEGTALVWQGDFYNARHLLDALKRRLDKPGRPARPTATAPTDTALPALAHAFHQQRMAQGRRARVLGSILVPLRVDHSIPLRRAPDWSSACAQAWDTPAHPPSIDTTAGTPPSAAAPADQGLYLIPLRELLGIASASEWRKKGVPIPALCTQPPRPSHRAPQRMRGRTQSSTHGPRTNAATIPAFGPTYDRIHPHYGVFSPVRGEYADLVAQAPLPAQALQADAVALDIGTGTGILAAILARRGVPHIIATDSSPRALACAADNMQRLGTASQVHLVLADLYPSPPMPCATVQADLIICNPPWLPVRAVTLLEQAVYDTDSRMLRGYLDGLRQHLRPGGEGWLILSDLAERLGLRHRDDLPGWIHNAGLRILGRLDTRPRHAKASDPTDPLHTARAAEVTSLWRLGSA